MLLLTTPTTFSWCLTSIPLSPQRLLSSLRCFVSAWMNDNQLKLNPDKTELILTGGPANSWNANFWPSMLGSHPLPATSVKSLGIVISNDLSMNAQLGSVVSACFFHLRRIRKISRFLTTLVILALVMLRIDYVNSLYAGIPAYQLQRLQLVQNQAARLIARQPRRQHFKPLMKSLHWLPVAKRCAFKVGCTIFKALTGNGSIFISSRIQRYIPSRELRSSNLNLLTTPSFKCKKHGGSDLQS